MRALTYGSSMRVDRARVGQLGRALEQLHRAVGVIDVVLHARHRRDEVEIELALEPLLHDLHVQQAEEAAAEAEAERGGRLRLVVQRSVVELQLLERVAQSLVLLRVRRIEPGEHHRVHVLVAGQRLDVRLRRVEDGVAGARLLHRCARWRRRSRLRPARARRSRPGEAGCSRPARPRTTSPEPAANRIFIPGLIVPSIDAHARNGAAVAIVVRIVDQRAERRVGIAFRRRHALDDRLEQLGNADAFLGAHEQDVVGIGADQVVHFLLAPFGLGAGKIDLVEDRDDLEPGVEREEQIRQRLRLNALRRVDDEDRAFARGERARHFVREVDVARACR